MIEGLQVVLDNIKIIYTRRQLAVIALCERYAALALNYFREVQDTGIDTQGKFWKNETTQAARRWFTRGFLDLANKEAVVRAAQGVDYGVYLELANHRQNESIRPVIKHFKDDFLKDVKRLYGE